MLGVWWSRRAGMRAAFCASLCACALPFDDIGFTGGGGQGPASSATVSTTSGDDVTGSTVSGFGGADCTANSTGQCVPPVPSPWNGPVLMADDAVPNCGSPALEGGLASDATLPDTAIASTPPDCACTCTTAPSSCTLEVDPICDTGMNPIDVPPGACRDVEVLEGVAQDVKISGFGAGECTPGAAVTTPGEVSFNQPRDACAVDVTTDGCTGGAVCVPAAQANVCVWQIGQLASCDSAPGYPVQKLLVGDILDTRSCAAGTCSCNPNQAGCLGNVVLYSDPGCLILIGAVAAENACSPLPSMQEVQSARYALTNPNYTCAVNINGVPAVDGGVTADPAQVHTLCCLD